jgi:hypothetical protein
MDRYHVLNELPINCRTSPGVEIARATSGLFGFVMFKSGLHAPASATSVAPPAKAANLCMSVIVFIVGSVRGRSRIRMSGAHRL